MEWRGRRIVAVVCPLVFLMIFFSYLVRENGEGRIQEASRQTINLNLSNEVQVLIEREARIDETLWIEETLAQELGSVLTEFWDGIREADDKLDYASRQVFGVVLKGEWRRDSSDLVKGLEKWSAQSSGEALSESDWRAFVSKYARAGWSLEFIELRHVRFDSQPGKPNYSSRIELALALENQREDARLMIRGPLLVDWSSSSLPDETPVITKVDCQLLELTVSRGSPGFRLVFEEVIPPPQHAYSQRTNSFDGLHSIACNSL